MQAFGLQAACSVNSVFYCLYRNFGALLTSRLEGGNLLLFNNERGLTEELRFKTTCCTVGLCDLFYEQRPSDNCRRYRPPRFCKLYYELLTGHCHLSLLLYPLQHGHGVTLISPPWMVDYTPSMDGESTHLLKWP